MKTSSDDDGSRYSMHPHLLSVFYIGVWMSLSNIIVVSNKYLLNEHVFPYPISLTLMHMAFSTVLAICYQIATCTLPLEVSYPVYFRNILPISFLNACVLFFSNADIRI